jgi:hypothetical protein
MSAEMLPAPPGIDGNGHLWMGAAAVTLTLSQARRAVLRGSIRIAVAARVDILETYCGLCRRPYDDVAGDPCVAASSTEHLHGGPIGTRKKRLHNHDCDLAGCNDPDPRELKRNGLAAG